MTDSDQARKTKPSFIVFAITLVYTAGFMLWYSATPLGIVPLLDGKENLQIAESIYHNTLPAEPFYRAPFYPACLSLFRTLGFSSDTLPFLARLFNATCHLVSTLLVYAIARKLWQQPIAAVAASLLYGLNPVALHFAADPLDITLAITLLLAALWYTLQATANNRSLRYACLAGLCIGVGTLTRPHLLLVAGILPVPLFCNQRLKGIVQFACTLLVLIGFACINLAISGQFKLLPTQGAYNVWAANKPGAHGKYLSQSIFIHNQEQHANPTRLEARALYIQETGATPPVSEAAINRYWRHKFVTAIVDQPLTWMRQMGLKLYYLLNNYEQYNNKTYQVHKSLSPWLQYNPINWTWLLVAGLAGLMWGIRKPDARLTAYVALTYAVGVWLFFVSARFRLPLVPLLAILAGGCATAVPTLTSIPKKKLVAATMALIGIGTLSLTPFAKVNDAITIAEDFVLLAQANAELQNSKQAQLWAEQALVANPGHQTARELVCIAKYNRLIDQLPSLPPPATLQQNLVQCLQVTSFSDQAQFIAGMYAHLLGLADQAHSFWYTLVDKHSKQMQPALAALKLTHSLRPQDAATIQSIPMAEMRPMLLISQIHAGDSAATERLSQLLSPEETQHHFAMIDALFFRERLKKTTH